MRYLIALLISLTVCTINSKAQTVTISEKLDNGEYVVLIDNVPQRTLTSAHADEIKGKLGRLAILETALPVCRQENTDYKARLDTEIARSKNWHDLFDGEHKLREDMQVFVKRPSKATSWLDSIPAQLIFKAGLPLLNTALQTRH